MKQRWALLRFVRSEFYCSEMVHLRSLVSRCPVIGDRSMIAYVPSCHVRSSLNRMLTGGPHLFLMTGLEPRCHAASLMCLMHRWVCISHPPLDVMSIWTPHHQKEAEPTHLRPFDVIDVCISSMHVMQSVMHSLLLSADVIGLNDVAMLSMQFSASVFDVSDAFDVTMMLMHSC